ncbi:Laccase-16 [Stylophora pistillata]|uniref:Laccase-16 n=1 Tax=Stylophora pistillata TaxID=50429 RepID=A0A2B4RE03_STYPI|nr:Laccase-16 [Stylophora pistillata]
MVQPNASLLRISYVGFPRKPEKDDHGDEEDGVVEDIEEQFDKPIKDLKNSRESTKQYLKTSDKDPRKEEYIREHKDFPRKPEKDDHGEEDGVLEDIEEPFYISMEHLANSGEFPKQNFQISNKYETKEVSENSRVIPNMDSQTPGKRFIAFVKVVALMGKRPLDDSEDQLPKGNLVLKVILNDNKVHQAELKGIKYQDPKYEKELNTESDFNPPLICTGKEIRKVNLTSPRNNGWYVASIDTFTAGSNKVYTKLTTDPGFSMWVDGNEEHHYPYQAKEHLLTNAVAGSCITYVRVEAMTTGDMEMERKSYFLDFILSQDQKIRAELAGYELQSQSSVLELNFASRFRPKKCVSMSHIEEVRLQAPNQGDANWYISSIRTSAKTGEDQYVDLTSDLQLNKRFGRYNTRDIKLNWLYNETLNCEYGNPTCKCRKWKKVCIFNLEIDEIRTFTSYQKLSDDEPTGIALRGAQGVSYYFDRHGIPLPLQSNRTCSTLDRAKCTYPQFVDGKTYRLAIAVNGQIPGPTLIVHEGQRVIIHVHNNLTTEDKPDQHTLTLLDWQLEASLDLFTQTNADLGLYEKKPLGEVPTPDDPKYNGTRSFDNGGAGPMPYFSGIINGKGRHDDVKYNKTRLSIFTVRSGETYRFRLIGAQGLYSYTFSIDGHKLTVVNTDGYWTKPVKDVDYIMIHPGERYDFLLSANDELNLTDYWMRAETMEINQTRSGPPYQSLGHVAEAILHYEQDDDGWDPDDNVPSSEYEKIKKESPRRKCIKKKKCRAVNCPFKNFHDSYNISCTNVHDLRLLEPTPPEELRDANPTKGCTNCRHFVNFHFEGQSDTSSVNGRNFILPSFPPQTQYDNFTTYDTICDLRADCNPSTLECSCVHVIDIPYNKTVQMVFSSIGATPSAHPIHLHGHTFHVVAVGYPEYNGTTGFVQKPNSDIYCDDIKCTKEGCVKSACTRPRWKTDPMCFPIDPHTIRKDTVMVPAGGYVVINFLSDNPGQWFLHCHKELHQLEGMALIVNEALGEQRKLHPPDGMNKCGDFILP